jgi:sorbitol/mannitol transport system permease protein
MIFSAFLVPPAAAALTWKTTMLDPNYGLVGFLLGTDADWIANWPMAVIVAVTAWQWAPFAMLIIFAGLQNQDESAKEAAMTDGAGPLRVFWHITLPHLRPHIEVTALLGAIFISQLLDPIFLITQGGPGNATTTAAYKLHSLAFKSFDVGLASAFGVVVVFLTIVTTLILLRLAVKSIREDLR